MPNNEEVVGGKFTLDISELKAGIAEANRTISQANAEFKKATSGMDKWSESADGLSAKSKQLSTIIEQENKKLANLKQQYELVAKAEGENSAAAQRMLTSITNQEAKIGNLNRQLKNNEDAYNKLVNPMNDVEKSIFGTNKAIDKANAEFKKATNGIADYTRSFDGLKAKSKQLNTIFSEQAKQVKKSETEYKKLVSQYGKSSNEVKQFEKKLKDEYAALDKTKKALKENDDALEKFSKSTSNAGKSTGSFTSGLKALAGGVGKAAKAGIVALGAAAAGAVTSFFALAESTREYRQDMARLQQNTKDAGGNFEQTAEAMKYLNGVSQETDSNIEGLSNLMAAGFKDNQLLEATQALSGAVIKFPDTLKIESLADGLQETLATGAATGQFGELIERLGGNLDVFNQGLANCTTEAEKQQYALDWLAQSGLAETDEAYRKQNKSLIDAADAQFRMTEATATLGAAAEPLVAILKNGLAAVLEKIAPLVQQVSAALQQLFSGDIAGAAQSFGDIFLSLREKAEGAFTSIINAVSEQLPKILPMIADILVKIVEQIINSVPLLLDAGIKLLGGLIDAIPPTIDKLLSSLPKIIKTILDVISNAIPKVLDGAIKLLNKIVEAIPKVVDSLVKNLPKIINTIVNFLTNNMPKLLDKAVDFLMQIVKAIPKIITMLVQNLPKIITTILNALINALPKVLGAAVKMFMGIIEAIPQIIAELISNLPQIISTIVKGLGEGVKDLFDVGVNLMKGLWDGIKSMFKAIVDGIKNFGKSIVSGFKKVFGIHSPSTVMRDEIGKNLAAGIGVGFQQEMKSVQKGMNAAIDFSSAKIGVPHVNKSKVGGSVVGGAITYVQNIYSPKAPSRLELYMQTKNLLGNKNGGYVNV